MTITEIKTKYPNKTFINVNEFKQDFYANVKKLQDIIDLDETFLYTYVELDEFEATDLIIDFIADEARAKLRAELTINREAIKLVDDVVNDYYDELIAFCKIKSAKFLHIRSFKYGIEYSEEYVPISEEQRDRAVAFILEKRILMANELVTKRETQNETIVDYIKTKKEYFLSLQSQSAKDKFIKNLQFKLEEEFADYDLSKFTQTYVAYLLSDFE